MKKKIVINLPMHGEKARSKAMKIAVGIQGVISVSIGEESDRLEVIGEGVDSVRLANSLRKKFCFAEIMSVGEVKVSASSSASTSPGSSPPRPSSPPKPCGAAAMQYCPPPPYCPQPPPFYYDYRVYDPAPPNCSIL